MFVNSIFMHTIKIHIVHTYNQMFIRNKKVPLYAAYGDIVYTYLVTRFRQV